MEKLRLQVSGMGEGIMKRKLLVAGLLFTGVIAWVHAQDVKTAPEKKKTRVDLLYADEAQVDKYKRPDTQMLIGSVKLRHDSMYMYCDTAYIFEKSNSVEAFNNVRMEQGDTLFIYGDYLYYDGVSQIAMLRGNVRMINRNTTLTTDSLNYDRILNLGYYFQGGTLTDEQNVLTSVWGEYSPATKIAVFNHEVNLENPKFVLTSDTLEYSTENKIATILGPSNIVSQQNHIYSELGIYNTVTEQAELLNRSVLTNQGKRLTGDSLFYDRHLGYGEAFNNVQMNDSVNRNMLTGNYCYYNELTGHALATQRAVAVDYSQGDSLYVHGDTLRLLTFDMNTDSMYREMRAYHKVRIYRTDVQAVCDSLVYNSKDSCMTMYTDPVLWHATQQLLGEEIKVYMKDGTINWAHIINQALTVERMDSIHYNQVSGKEMKAFFIEGDMRQVDVNGSVMLIYYPVDDKDTTLIGLNYAEGGFLRMNLKERKMEKGMFIGKANGTMFPMSQIPADKYRLPSYVWFDYIRPRNKEDIFDWRGKKAGDELPKSDRRQVTPGSLHIRRTGN
jgi:lipopolysaccharide export system protein LptA